MVEHGFLVPVLQVRILPPVLALEALNVRADLYWNSNPELARSICASGTELGNARSVVSQTARFG